MPSNLVRLSLNKTRGLVPHFITENISSIIAFTENEIILVGGTVHLRKLLETLQGVRALVLQAELEFLAVH